MLSIAALLSKGEPLPFTDTDETELEIVKFVKWLVSNFGVKFIPVGFNADTGKTLRTKKDWLAFLTEYIDEKENELYEEV